MQDKEMIEESETKAEDSDYFTPEDPQTTILSPVKSSNSTPVDKVVNNFETFFLICNLSIKF